MGHDSPRDDPMLRVARASAQLFAWFERHDGPAGDAVRTGTGARAGTATGMRTVTAVPSPRVLSMLIWPPCSSASARTSDRPRPVP